MIWSVFARQKKSTSILKEKTIVVANFLHFDFSYVFGAVEAVAKSLALPVYLSNASHKFAMCR